MHIRGHRENRMKITKTKLKQLIKEELQKALKEIDWETAAEATDPKVAIKCNKLANRIKRAKRKYLVDPDAIADQQRLEALEQEFKELNCAEKIKLSKKMGVETVPLPPGFRDRYWDG